MSVAARCPSQCPEGKLHAVTEVFRDVRIRPGEPVVEQPEGDADAAGDGGHRAVGRFGRHGFQDRRSEGGVVRGHCFDDEAQRGHDLFAGRADGGESGHVAAFDGAVHRRLQCLQVGHVDAVDVNAFFGQQRCQFLQHLVGQPWLVLDQRRTGRWFRASPAHVGHVLILAGRRRDVSGVLVHRLLPPASAEST